MRYSIKIIAVPGLLAVLASCAGLPSGTAQCLDRKGYCFDAMINGQPVVPLETHDGLARYHSVSHYVNEVAWELPRPIRDEVNVRVTANEQGRDWMGPRMTVQVSVVPLGDYKLDSTPVLSKQNDVLISGHAAATVRHVLNENRLPPGQYLFRIKATGRHWDRKTVFVTVQ